MSTKHDSIEEEEGRSHLAENSRYVFVYVNAFVGDMNLVLHHT